MFIIGDGDINCAIILEMSVDDTEGEDNLWCHYSGMPSPMAYMECEDCGEMLSECECIEKK